MPNQTELRNQVNEKIIAALSRGLAPWRKPWTPMKNTGHPANAATGKRYRGVNPLLLQLAALDKGYSSKHWATYRQWQALGAQVRGGERGTRIIFWQPITKTSKNADGEEESKSFPLLKEYCVFNAQHCDGAETYQVEPGDSTAAIADFEPAEMAISATGATIKHVAGDMAAYHRPPDFIVMPLKEQFQRGRFGAAAYYETAFHEILHWSESRLGWTGSYALGELRAEIGACYCSAEVGIPNSEDLQNHAKYLDCWLKAMKADSRVIFQIASAASKGTDFIMSFSRQPEPVKEELVMA